MMLKKIFQTCGSGNGPIITTKRLLASSRVKEVVEPNISPVAVDSQLFNDIKSRVYNNRENIEKIVVRVKQGDSYKSYLLNKNDSTPSICAKHASVQKLANFALAEMSYESGTVEYHSMNAPVSHKCDISFIDINTTNPQWTTIINQAYWLSCSVLLGAVLKQGVQVNVASSIVTKTPRELTFAVDINGLKESDLTTQDLLDLSRFASREFISAAKPFEILNVSDELAKEYGLNNSVSLCKLDDFVTIVPGPTIAHTGQIGRFSIVGKKQIKNSLRLSGVSVPSSQPVSSQNWDLIRTEAGKAT
ncbi:unnamed protein product [Auanema sp. JU1783]|nr:unnamed protein product [Auanema sp. JU1783]